MVSVMRLVHDMNVLHVRFRPNHFPEGYYYDFVKFETHMDRMLAHEILCMCEPDMEKRHDIITLMALMWVMKDNKKLIRSIVNTNTYLRTIMVQDNYPLSPEQHILNLKKTLARE